jgi:hypothetical protein
MRHHNTQMSYSINYFIQIQGITNTPFQQPSSSCYLRRALASRPRPNASLQDYGGLFHAQAAKAPTPSPTSPAASVSPSPGPELATSTCSSPIPSKLGPFENSPSPHFGGEFFFSDHKI